jgi:uridine kinase
VLTPRCWVVGIDGRSGTGKSTLAAALAGISGAPVVSLDDLYPGWDGLEAGVDRLLAGVLQPLTAGRDGRYRRFDWATGHDGPEVVVPFHPTLIVEGCGALALRCRPYLAQQIWLTAPAAVRYDRAMARDGAAYRPYWSAWADQENQHYRRNRPR